MRLLDFFSENKHAPWCTEGEGGVLAVRTQAELLVQARAVATHLRAKMAAKGDTQASLALACLNLRNFAPGLLGAWAAGATVHLLPNTQRATLDRAYKSYDWFLHDVAEAEHFSAQDIYLPKVIVDSAVANTPDLDDHTMAAHVVFSTSGTTGAPQQSHKTVRQLLEEAKVLATLFGDVHTVLSTVPASHLYGLLFGLLVPLQVGAKIVREQAFMPSDVSSAMQKHAVDLLVSTPSHLTAMAQSEMPKSVRVVSSGARLQSDLFYSLMTNHDWRVTDVLGSTETGGIATRNGPISRWHPLPGVHLQNVDSADGELTQLHSEWCDGGTQALGDILIFDQDGTFVHAGRRDDVVKIAGKRLALSALEDFLKRIPGVTDAAVLFDQSRAQGREPRLRYALAGDNIDKSRVIAAVRREFDPVFAPRQIVIVPKLPRVETGKLPKQALIDLFGGGNPNTVDTVILQYNDDGSVECDVPHNFLFFSGHFDALPVLPGAALLERIVMPALRVALQEQRAVTHLKRIRFSKPVLPGSHLLMRFVRNVERKDTVSFEVISLGGAVATGTCLFSSGDAP